MQKMLSTKSVAAQKDQMGDVIKTDGVQKITEKIVNVEFSTPHVDEIYNVTEAAPLTIKHGDCGRL
jgi:hypothetical protein